MIINDYIVFFIDSLCSRFILFKSFLTWILNRDYIWFRYSGIKKEALFSYFSCQRTFFTSSFETTNSIYAFIWFLFGIGDSKFYRKKVKNLFQLMKKNVNVVLFKCRFDDTLSVHHNSFQIQQNLWKIFLYFS